MEKPNKCNDFLDHAPVALAKEVVLLDVDQKNLERGMTAPWHCRIGIQDCFLRLKNDSLSCLLYLYQSVCVTIV